MEITLSQCCGGLLRVPWGKEDVFQQCKWTLQIKMYVGKNPKLILLRWHIWRLCWRSKIKVKRKVLVRAGEFTWRRLSLVSRYSCWLLISFLWISSCIWSCWTSSLLFSSSSRNCSSCSSRLQIWVDRYTWHLWKETSTQPFRSCILLIAQQI